MAASTFSITTVTGSEPMQLQLRGRALPYQPFTLEGAMRSEVTWYPGNAVATIQMLGAEEKSSSVAGMWKDRFIKSVTDEGASVDPTGVALFNNQAVADVFSLVGFVEKLRLAGQLVRVEWDSIVREGILSRFRQTWKRREDVEWEMEFAWVSRGEKQKPVTLSSTTSANSFATQLRAGLDAITTALTPPSFPVIEDFTTAVDSALSEIDDAVLQVENAVQNSVQQISVPSDSAERALAATETIKTSASEIVTTCESYPPLLVIKNETGESLGMENALVASNYLREIKTAARDLQMTASDQADTLRAQVRQETLLASFVARAPTDLRDVSQKYYGTPDEWRSLVIYNNFESSRVDAGDLILVPKLNSVYGRV